MSAPIPAPSPAPSSPAGSRMLVVLFLVALTGSFYCVTFNWHSGFLIGHEFRQTQTALITRYIDEQNNFSLHYETPLFGKPWEAPLELPLYEWAVVGVKRATGWPDYEAARTVSVAFLYLTLPAFYILLGQAGVPRPRRLLSLIFLLSCPVYLFYARAFLMDSMVLCFAAWFLALFVQTLRTRRWSWLLASSLCGAAAGTAKSVVLLVWLLPAAAYGAWALWKDWRNGRGWSALARTAAWGAAGAVMPLGCTLWWIRFTDAIKAGHPSAHIFTSREMSMGNFGTFNLTSRLDPQMWTSLLAGWNLAIMRPWWLLAAVGAAILVADRMRRAVLGAAGLWFAAQMLLPYAYAYQDYYFYSITIFLMAAFGLAAHGALESRLPLWLRWGWLVLPLAGLWTAYLDPHGYRAMQRFWSPGGNGLTDALRATTPKNSVIVVAGSDWSAIIPHYAKRRALMIRNGLENDAAYLDRAFADLRDENVSALVLVEGQRGNQDLVRRATAAFDLAPAIAFSHATADVYMRRFYLETAIGFLAAHNNFDSVTMKALSAPRQEANGLPVKVPPNLGASAFEMIHPVPSQCRMPFGYGTWAFDEKTVLQAHSSTDIWVPAPLAARTIEFEFGILPYAYEAPGRTDGVEFFIYAETAQNRRQVFARRLDPQSKSTDRGTQRAMIDFHPRPDETLIFATRPGGADSFDWAYFQKIEVR